MNKERGGERDESGGINGGMPVPPVFNCQQVYSC